MEYKIVIPSLSKEKQNSKIALFAWDVQLDEIATIFSCQLNSYCACSRKICNFKVPRGGYFVPFEIDLEDYLQVYISKTEFIQFISIR